MAYTITTVIRKTFQVISRTNKHINRRGLEAAAAVGIVEKIISFLFLIPSSMLSTVSALGAQNIGAGKQKRAEQTMWCAALIAVVFGLIVRLNDLHGDGIPSAFNQGAADLLGAAMCVGMAQGIIIILGGTDASSGTVLNTILHSLSGAMQNFPPVVSAWLMYVFQSVFNFFVVSGSGQAALTMPIMAPLADLVGVERQVAVLAFQLGDAFTNFIVPTSGCLLGALAAAKLEWGSWAKFQIKFQAVLVVFASLAVVLGVVIGLS